MRKRRLNSYYEKLIEEIAEEEGIPLGKNAYLCWNCIYNGVCDKKFCIFSSAETATYNE